MTTETSTTPNKAHLLQWARALESGIYKQGEHVLKNSDNEFCCLGVACDIASEAIGGHWETSEGNSTYYTFITRGGNKEVSYLPGDVAAWLGINAIGLNINPELDGYSATCRNDLWTDSFAEIAAAIRQEFNLGTKEQDEHRLAWIKALESGNYKQGERRLQTEGKYCCLGVACDIAKDDIGGRWEAASALFGEGAQGFIVGDDSKMNIAYLPIQVAEWLGFTGNSAVGHYYNPKLGHYYNPKLNGAVATDRNDTLHNSFAEIAAAARVEFGYPTLEDEINQHRLAWIEALESEDYPQTSGQLKNNQGFCCLGVACEVAKDDVNGEWTGGGLDAFTFKVPGEDPRTGILPLPVAAWLGLKEIDPYLAGKSATERNDYCVNSFAEIAAAAREQFGFPPKA